MICSWHRKRRMKIEETAGNEGKVWDVQSSSDFRFWMWQTRIISRRFSSVLACLLVFENILASGSAEVGFFSLSKFIGGGRGSLCSKSLVLNRS